MAYLGNTPTTQNFVSGTDYFNGTGSQTAFTLSRTVGSINDIQVTVNNVVQQPNDAYTLSGTTLTMTSAPSSGTNNVYVRYLSTTTQVITPSQNTVGTAQLGTITNIASGNSSLTLQTGSSPTTALTIDTSQNVGIGVTNPSVKLQVNGATTIAGTIIQNAALFQMNGNGNADLRLVNTAGTTGRRAFDWLSNGDNLRARLLSDDGSSLITDNLLVLNWDGNIGVGTSGVSGSKFTILQSNSINTQYLVNSNASTCYGMQIYYSARTPNNTGEEFIYCGDTGQRFSARSNGGLANYSGNNVNLSDEREKTNIELAGNYLSKICSIPVKTFNYIDQNREEDDGLTLGVIAQDVQNVAPELIMESNWGTKEEPKMRFGIYQTDLQYALMKAIQELNAKVEAQAVRIAELEGAK